jgi:Raf kinase inhibitor-like YbhB/YbcL family protein
VAAASTIPPVSTDERFGTKRRRFGTIKITPRSYSISSPDGGKYDENRIEVAAAIMVMISGTAIAAPFSVSSADMREGDALAQRHWFGGFGCTGGNISPQIAWQNAPAGTRSFAVTAYDPDAPTGSGWWHWTVVNIAQQVTSLAAGAGDKNNAKLPAGAVQGRNDFGYAGFGGACPPAGDKPHRYRFTVWALDTRRCPLMASPAGR